MLSLREFCIALHLMERYREGRPLPTVLPDSVMSDGSYLLSSGQPAATYGGQQPEGTKTARPITCAGGGKPPRPVPVPQPDEPIQQRAKVPVLEKHHVDQLSIEEQDCLNIKFQEAKDAEKKVAELEKDILEAKQKIQFYHAKMQELILYKSRCDNRLNEITEKVVTDKREAESLAKRYEEKYKQVGDVASRLTIEEATFRDIQEKKMELYRGIVKLEQDNADDIQDRANQIQSDLEEIVKVLNERCKTYGLRGKPTSLVELPFGWQPGIGGSVADWNDAWDKFENEGFTYVKEFTLDVQNVIAPPKPKSSLIREKVTSLDNSGVVKSPSKDDNKLEQRAKSAPDSPSGSNAFESSSQELQIRDINVNGSSHAFDTQSDYGGTESVFSGDKGFDEPSWGTFDTHYDAGAAWDFNPDTPKDADRKRHNESSLLGGEEWGLSPIRTGSGAPDTMFPKQGPFFDSVPSTPLYNSANSPHADTMLFTRTSPFAFADSVPSTPMYNYSSSSPTRSEEHHSFDSFSRFDSFNMNDSGPFSSSESFTRFDSVQSTRDSEFDQGRQSLARFDSFRSTTDSDYNFGLFPPSDGHGFPSFDDPFGSSRTSIEAQTPRKILIVGKLSSFTILSILFLCGNLWGVRFCCNLPMYSLPSIVSYFIFILIICIHFLYHVEFVTYY